MLQCVAVSCSELQCAAVYCSELQFVTVCVLQRVYCSVLQCVAECVAGERIDLCEENEWQCVAVCCSVLQCVAAGIVVCCKREDRPL